MKTIKKYKGVDLKYDEERGDILFNFEGLERRVRYIFEAERIIDEPKWVACDVKGFFSTGYTDKYIGLAKAERKCIKSGQYDWKIKGQYDLEYKDNRHNEKIFEFNQDNAKIYKEWEEQKTIFNRELRKLNGIVDKLS